MNAEDTLRIENSDASKRSIFSTDVPVFRIRGRNFDEGRAAAAEGKELLEARQASLPEGWESDDLEAGWMWEREYAGRVIASGTRETKLETALLDQLRGFRHWCRSKTIPGNRDEAAKAGFSPNCIYGFNYGKGKPWRAKYREWRNTSLPPNEKTERRRGA